MGEVVIMRIYYYKDIPTDYSHLTIEELNKKIEEEKERIKGKTWEELCEECEN